MPRVFIAMGSNLGERYQSLEKARELLSVSEDLHILRVSPVYETDPVGGPPQGKYLNAVLEAETTLSAGRLLSKLLEVERTLGRERKEPCAPRAIDLDLLFYGDQRIKDRGLTVPHPRLHERYFVLKPLADLAPDFVHPVLQKTVREMLRDLNVHLDVQ